MVSKSALRISYHSSLSIAMKYFLDLIWRYIGDIFIDGSQGGELDINAIQIQDLTLHYKQDFPKIALDSICVGPPYFKVQ